MSRCWRCDEPVGKYGAPDPFLIADDDPWTASICTTCLSRPELAITFSTGYGAAIDADDLAQIGRWW